MMFDLPEETFIHRVDLSAGGRDFVKSVAAGANPGGRSFFSSLGCSYSLFIVHGDFIWCNGCAYGVK
jgi:hypothetical protein